MALSARRIRLSLFVGSFLAVLATGDAGASDPPTVKELMARARAAAVRMERTPQPSVAAPAWGLDDPVTLSTHAYAFQGSDSTGDHLMDDGNGYRYLTSTTSGGYIAAPVSIPSGVVIESISVSYCAGLFGELTMALVDGGSAGAPNAIVGSVTTSLNLLCLTESTQLDYPYDSTYAHPLYFVIHWEGPLDGSLKFNGVNLTYSRRVSPAPAVATFNDVPVGHPFFQFVEALAASGITVGCGNGAYCPDSPLTRGQMAVFLAKALGLHWPG